MDDRAVVEALSAARPDLIAVYRYGSTVDGSAVAESDVDYALLAAEPVDERERFDLLLHLSARSLQPVDLVDLRRVSTVLQMEVVGRGVLVAERDRAAREAFEDFVFSSFARLNEERRGVLERIHSEGTVYGR